MLSLFRLECEQKHFSNPFRIRIFLCLSYSFGIETINTFIHCVVPSKTIPDSRPKWAKCVPVFRPKRRKNPTRWGGTYLYSLSVQGSTPRGLRLCSADLVMVYKCLKNLTRGYLHGRFQYRSKTHSH